MESKLESLIPNLTSALVTKVLFVELYFLLTVSKSPVYFTLTDFLDSHTIELLYISVTAFLLTPWIVPIALAIYVAVAGLPSWIAVRLLGLIKFDGFPVFKVLSQRQRDKSVSVDVTKDYAFRNGLPDLSKRLAEYQSEQKKKLEGESIAAANFFLILLIVMISSASAPNFLMKVTGVLEPYLGGYAYSGVVTLLLIQGFVGRMTGFCLLKYSGYLPPDFFVDEGERMSAEGWAGKMASRHEPYLLEWLRRNS